MTLGQVAGISLSVVIKWAAISRDWDIRWRQGGDLQRTIVDTVVQMWQPSRILPLPRNCRQRVVCIRRLAGDAGATENLVSEIAIANCGKFSGEFPLELIYHAGVRW
jgi:hypothetical protein